MKPTLYAAFITLIIGTSLSANAQTIYNVTANVSTSSFGSGVICTNCIVVISPGVTLTIDNTASCNTCTFTGGTISIVPGSNFTLSGVDSIKNATVLIGQSFNMGTLTFYGDTVAFNAPMNLSGGRTDFDSSRVSINAALTLNKGTFYKDSLHLNSNLTFTNSVDSFAYSNISVASGVTIAANQSKVINSTFAFAGSSSMSVTNGLTSTGSNYYLGGTSTLSSTSTTLSGDNIVMSGTTNSFSTVNALITTNTNITLSSTGSSTLSANSIAASGGSITGASGSVINSTNAINLSNVNTSLTGSTFSGNSLTTTGGTLNLNNTKATITNANNFTGTTITMSGNSALTGNSGSLSTSTLTMTGTAKIAVTNAFNIAASNAYMYGNDTLSANSMAISGGSFLRIGDGTLANTSEVTINNGFSVDNSSLLGIANHNNYLFTTNSSLKTNSISCGGGGSQHSCATNFVYGCGTIKNNAGIACIVLALADLNLSASITGPTQVAISWTDGATSAADHYDLQRNTGNDWNTITTIAAGANATGEYHFTDADAPAGIIEYRIIRIDQDGKTTYSSISTVTLARTNTPVSIHPNPVVGGSFFITTSSAAETMVNVFTMTGQLLLRTELKGQTQYPIHLPAQARTLGSVVVQTIGQTGTWTTTVLVR